MDEYLYRYIGFDSFVGMVQKQALTFVLPEIWEDPKENDAYYNLLKKQDSTTMSALLVALHNKTFAQCWTQLAESDAMWRIYAFGNRSVRIKISQKNVEKLENIRAIPVQYRDDTDTECSANEDTYLEAIAKKRKAFSHEQEIRLISCFKFASEEDFHTHVKALMAISEHPQRVEILESMYPTKTLEDSVTEVCKFLNVGNVRQTTKDVSFAHIPNFIEGVMVHPMAPDWFADVVNEYCRIHSIPFEGKSTLYTE